MVVEWKRGRTTRCSRRGREREKKKRDVYKGGGRVRWMSIKMLQMQGG